MTEIAGPKSREDIARTLPGPEAGSLANLGPPLFLATLLLAWISLDPFKDRSAAALASTTASGSFVNQLVYSAVFLAAIGLVFVSKPKVLLILNRPIYLATIVWLALSALSSGEPLLSLRRTLFVVVVIGISAVLLALPRDRRNLADLLCAAVLVVLAICYVSLVFVPDLAIHHANDASEPEHDGSWRGLFDHKNEAGATMAVFIFVGLFAMQVRNAGLGLVIVILSTIFLLFTRAKTPIALAPVVLLMAELFVRSASTWTRLAISLGLVVALNAFTVGASVPGPLQSMVARILPDPTYTGRTDLWRFALEAIGERPLLGYGYGGFWQTPEVVNREPPPYVTEGNGDKWAFQNGTDSHNAYVEVALSLGLPGLLLVLIWVTLTPILDYQNLIADPSNKPLSLLFVRMWLYGLYTSVFETVLFSRVSPLWVMMLLAMFGLRLMGRYRIAQ